MGHPEADGVRWLVQLPSAGEAAAGREWLCAPWQVAPVWIPSGGEREGVPIQAAFRVEGDAALVLVHWPEAIAAPGESSGVGTLRVGGVDERASGGCVCGVALWMNGGEEASRALVARAPRIGSAMVQVRAFRLPRAHQLLACSWADAVATGHANVSEDHLRGAADPSNGATLLDLQMVCAETTDHTTDSRRDPLQCRLVTTAGLVYTLPMLWETIDASTVLSQIPPRQVPSSSRSARHLPHLQPLCPGDQVVLLRGLDTLVSLPSGRPFSLSSVRADAQVIDVVTMNSTKGAPPCWLIGYADGAIAVVEATLDAEDAISLRALAWHHVPLPYRLIARPVGRQVAESQFADGPGVATAAPLPFLVQWRRQVHRVEFHRQQQQQQHTFTEHTVLGGDVRSLSFLDADTALVEWADEGDTDTFVAAVDADALLQAPRSDADHSDRFQPADVERLLDAVSEASTVWERSVHSDAAALNEAAAELNTALHYAALWAMRGGDKGAVAEPLSEWIAVHVRVQPALHETDTVRLCLSVSLRAERQDATKHPAAPPLSAHWSVMVSASAGACTCSPEHHGGHGGTAGNRWRRAHFRHRPAPRLPRPVVSADVPGVCRRRRCRSGRSAPPRRRDVDVTWGEVQRRPATVVAARVAHVGRAGRRSASPRRASPDYRRTPAANVDAHLWRQCRALPAAAWPAGGAPPARCRATRSLRATDARRHHDAESERRLGDGVRQPFRVARRVPRPGRVHRSAQLDGEHPRPAGRAAAGAPSADSTQPLVYPRRHRIRRIVADMHPARWNGVSRPGERAATGAVGGAPVGRRLSRGLTGGHAHCGATLPRGVSGLPHPHALRR
eukprot:ctg_2956.g466